MVDIFCSSNRIISRFFYSFEDRHDRRLVFTFKDCFNFYSAKLTFLQMALVGGVAQSLGRRSAPELIGTIVNR